MHRPVDGSVGLSVINSEPPTALRTKHAQVALFYLKGSLGLWLSARASFNDVSLRLFAHRRQSCIFGFVFSRAPVRFIVSIRRRPQG